MMGEAEEVSPDPFAQGNPVQMDFKWSELTVFASLLFLKLGYGMVFCVAVERSALDSDLLSVNSGFAP